MSFIVYSVGFSKALVQDFSEYISNVKVKMAEDGTMTTLRSVMRLCTQCVNRGVKVRQALFLVVITTINICV